MPTPTSPTLPFLLQLASPALPVGAFSYSEGLETLVQQGTLADADGLSHWLTQELTYGAVGVEAAIAVRLYQAAQMADHAALSRWNRWLSAYRETEEMRLQSWQMGRSLAKLLGELAPDLQSNLDACGEPCNFVAAFAIAACHWHISLEEALLGYLHSWATSLIGAGVKLIPLGQTQGQRVLMQLYPTLQEATRQALQRTDEALMGCGWGLAIASMQHETLYSRLFRS
jgi:urease accessory protein